MYFVSGASGKTGGALVRLLRRAGREVRTLTRSAERAGPLSAAGVEVVVGDGADPAVLARALHGVEKAVLIYPNGRHQGELERALVDAAVAAGTRHLVKLSSMEAMPDTTNPVHRMHYESEQHIRASGLDFTMIRPNFFMQNLLGNAATVRSEGRFFLPLGAGAAAMTDVRDVAEVIARVLEQPGHAGRIYAITGPEVLNFTQVAAQFSAVLGRPIEYVAQDPEAYKAYLGQFLRDPWHLEAVCAIFREIREGYVAPATDTFRKLIGRPPTDLATFIRDHFAAFAAPGAAGS
jgi:uncharacterized protein YbjT (DUF2867 family)